jgi:hypothetical protein
MIFVLFVTQFMLQSVTADYDVFRRSCEVYVPCKDLKDLKLEQCILKCIDQECFKNLSI